MKMVRKKSRNVSKIIFVVIFVGLLVAIGSVIFTNLYQNSFFAEKKFDELARSYYEDNLYETTLLENEGQELGEIFGKYRNGFKVKLRQVLSYEFLEHNVNYRTYFETEAFSCDTNETYATFMPHEPYGKKDYDVTFNLKCSKN